MPNARVQDNIISQNDLNLTSIHVADSRNHCSLSPTTLFSSLDQTYSAHSTGDVQPLMASAGPSRVQHRPQVYTHIKDTYLPGVSYVVNLADLKSRKLREHQTLYSPTLTKSGVTTLVPLGFGLLSVDHESSCCSLQSARNHLPKSTSHRLQGEIDKLQC